MPTVINSFYLAALGSYRAFYILNWIVRFFTEHHYFDGISVIFGIIQTAFYVDFAWVYYSRQRVKLRNGGVVDSEDYSNSWLVNKVLSFRTRRNVDEEQRLHDEDAEDERGADGQSRNNRWGARGISISADDTLENQGRPPKAGQENDEGLEGILEDEDDESSSDTVHRFPGDHH